LPSFESRRGFFLLPLLLAVALHIGCSTSRVVEMEAPSVSDAFDHTDDEARGSVNVILHTSSEMGSGIESTRFRVAEISFRRTTGQWIQRLSNREAISATRSHRSAVSLLSTELAAFPFDSLAISLSDVFVTYNRHAGGMLIPEDDPIQLPITLLPDPTEAADIHLQFHPAESVRLDTMALRWMFEPKFTVIADSAYSL